MNRLENKWLRDIQYGNDNINNTKILIACSGGGDSVALLIFLYSIRNILNIQLFIAHVHHNLRPEAHLEAELVKYICDSLKLPLIETELQVLQYAKTKKIGIETAARELRWSWFQNIAKHKQIHAVATGHNLNDHTETILIRLSRGGGIGCMTPLPRRQNLRWSPLIQAKRKDLRDYLKQKDIPWIDDKSNNQMFTPRNRWRKYLDILRSEAPLLDNNLWETHSQITELITLSHKYIYANKNINWQINQDKQCIYLISKIWNETELRWTLEAAFKELNWHYEASLLRNLSPWLMQYLQDKPKKSKCWSNWRLTQANDIINKRGSNDDILNTDRILWAVYKE